MRLKSPIDYFFSQNKNKGFSDTFKYQLSDGSVFFSNRMLIINAFIIFFNIKVFIFKYFYH
jgi:hypothetical protein